MAATPSATGLPALRAMLAEMEQAPAIVRPSAMWESLNELHLAQLEDRGFERFKRTVNQNYFNWVPGRGDQHVRALVGAWARNPTPRVLTARLTGAGRAEGGPDRRDVLPGRRARLTYAVFIALLWEAVRRRDRLGLLDRLQEPELGDPLTVRYRGRRVTQDLCNSVHELSAVVGELPGVAPPSRGVLELGGGYGRLAWAYLSAFPKVRYVLCDIPPALAIAERYLTTLFPERPAFRFRHFDDPAEVVEELASAQIAFLTPNQLDLLPPLGVGLFVNVSSLHEMRPEQIAHYLGAVDRHTRGFFYTKQWKRSRNPHDGVVIGRGDYPIPESWETVYSRDHEIQTEFFEALYRVR